MVILLHALVAAAPIVARVDDPIPGTAAPPALGPRHPSFNSGGTDHFDSHVRDRTDALCRLCMLRFVTLIPVVLVVTAALRIGSPVVDANLSARPVAIEINKFVNLNKPMPVALFRISRETEYGLQFYRDQTLSRYGLKQIPDEEHILVAAEGSQAKIAPPGAGTQSVVSRQLRSAGAGFLLG